MKRVLIALSLLASLCASSCFAAKADDNSAAAVGELKSECAAKYSAKLDVKSAAANEYHFVYAKGEFKGEAQPGMMLACTEDQYAAYLDSADPIRVMAAYPTAAGRPVVKK